MSKTATDAAQATGTDVTNGIEAGGDIRKTGKPVVVTSEHRGVFFGYVPQDADLTVKVLRVEWARMAVYWSADVNGVVGLAAKGPSNKGCRIGPAAPSMTIQAVTAVIEATPEAAVAWETAPWSR